MTDKEKLRAALSSDVRALLDEAEASVNVMRETRPVVKSFRRFEAFYGLITIVSMMVFAFLLSYALSRVDENYQTIQELRARVQVLEDRETPPPVPLP